MSLGSHTVLARHKDAINDGSQFHNIQQFQRHRMHTLVQATPQRERAAVFAVHCAAPPADLAKDSDAMREADLRPVDGPLRFLQHSVTA